MRVLIDSDVILDVLAEREPFHSDSAVVWALVEAERAEGVVSALTFSNVFYIARKAFGAQTALAGVRKVADVFDIATVDDAVVKDAIASGLPDFEDALQAFAGQRAGATHVVTRDAHGFVGAPLIVIAPAQLPAIVAAT